MDPMGILMKYMFPGERTWLPVAPAQQKNARWGVGFYGIFTLSDSWVELKKLILPSQQLQKNGEKHRTCMECMLVGSFSQSEKY